MKKIYIIISTVIITVLALIIGLGIYIYFITKDEVTVSDAPLDNKELYLEAIDKENNQSVIDSGEAITKAVVSSDGSISLAANINRDHRFFGYEKPDTNSKRLILFSIFTNDVENNPFELPLGAYYGTDDMTDLSLKYSGTDGDFIRAVTIDKANKETVVFFEKKWIEFAPNSKIK